MIHKLIAMGYAWEIGTCKVQSSIVGTTLLVYQKLLPDVKTSWATKQAGTYR